MAVRKFEWGKGYTKAELDLVQEKWNLVFPPDLLEFYLDRRPVGNDPSILDWIDSSSEKIKTRLEWPFEGLWFDVQNDALWLPEWGEKPEALPDQKNILQGLVDDAPRLIPLYSHRYLPETPNETGNPVFSVYQSDIIFYGADLADYWEREHSSWDAKPWPNTLKKIEFWTFFTEYDG